MIRPDCFGLAPTLLFEEEETCFMEAMMNRFLQIVIPLIAVLLLPGLLWGMDTVQQKDFDRIMKMKMSELTVAAMTQLSKKYPDENWSAHGFPSYVKINDSVEAGYRIALKEPDLLGAFDSPAEAGIPCYCSCDAFGHKTLLACFVKDGRPGNGFDEHGSDCNICYGQAMLAFLWREAGASQQDILDGMKIKFAQLLKSRE